MSIRAAGLGLEPRYSPPKGDVLPLDDPAIKYNLSKFVFIYHALILMFLRT